MQLDIEPLLIDAVRLIMNFLQAGGKNSPVTTSLLTYLRELSSVGHLSRVCQQDIRQPSDQGVWFSLASASMGAMSINGVRLRGDPVMILASPLGRKGVAPFAMFKVAKHVEPPREEGGAFTETLIPPQSLSISLLRESFHEDGEVLLSIDFEAACAHLLAPYGVPLGATWEEFFQIVGKRIEEALGCKLVELPTRLSEEYRPDIGVLLVGSKELGGDITESFDAMIQGKRQANLLGRVLGDIGALQHLKKVPVSITSMNAPVLLGHMDSRAKVTGGDREQFALDSTQRLAAMCSIRMRSGNRSPVMPVNGPPGTGKTSFLRAVVASEVVAAAYRGDDSPPLIIGTGATNKAVTNMIEAFVGVADSSKDVLEFTTYLNRWMPGIDDYAWLYPSRDAAKQHPGYMHLIGDVGGKSGSKLELGGTAADFGNMFIGELAKYYVLCARKSFKVLDDAVNRIERNTSLKDLELLESQVDIVVSKMKASIAKYVEEMEGQWGRFSNALLSCCSSNPELTATRRELQKLYKNRADIANLVKLRKHEAETYMRAKRDAMALLKHWSFVEDTWRIALPAFTHRFTLREENQKLEELRKACEFSFKGAGLKLEFELKSFAQYVQKIKVIHQNKSDDLARTEKAFLAINSTIEVKRRMLCEIRESRRALVSVLKDVLGSNLTAVKGDVGKEIVSLWRHQHHGESAPNRMGRDQAVDRLHLRVHAQHDVDFRVHLFHFACRYWEGRWIQRALREVSLDFTASEFLRLGDSLELTRYLGFMIVVTTASLPRLTKRHEADLLVIDEAGQSALPYGAFALSRAHAAVVVGDDKQLSPIVSASKRWVDSAARTADLDPRLIPDELNGLSGSALSLARLGSWCTDGLVVAGRSDHGVTLRYHYRCHPDIIGYCNDLMYSGTVCCNRKGGRTKSGIPALSWIDVREKPIRRNRKLSNPAEVEQIASWVKENQERLVQAYGLPLSEIVAVVTPYKRQAQLISAALRKNLSGHIDSEIVARITVGTVHSLQGAERPIVLFSLVDHLGGKPLFADSDEGRLMNVAVSRAKDAFVMVGHAPSFMPREGDGCSVLRSKATPVALLGSHLRERGAAILRRSLVIVEAPGKVGAIKQALGAQVTVIATGGTLSEMMLDSTGVIHWTAVPDEFAYLMKHEVRDANEIVIATDDDIAGELIGFHALQAIGTDEQQRVKIRRMRFHSLQKDDLQRSFINAASGFDSNMLKAAMTKEALRLLDGAAFTSTQAKGAGVQYASAQKRDLLATVASEERLGGYSVMATLVDLSSGDEFTAFLASGQDPMATPALLSIEEARATVQSMQSQTDNQDVIEKSIDLVLDLQVNSYPANTSPRVLAMAANELGMSPWQAQEHLNAMYLNASLEQGLTDGVEGA